MTLHQIHIFYVIASPMRPTNSIENLFAALESLDPLEVRHMIGLPMSLVGATYDDALPTEEDVAQSMIANFKDKCLALVKQGMPDFFVTYAVVLGVLNILRNWGDEVCAEDNSDRLRSAIPFFQARAAEGKLSREEMERMVGMAQEAINNRKGNAELYRERYNLFCDVVVRKLVGPGPIPE